MLYSMVRELGKGLEIEIHTNPYRQTGAKNAHFIVFQGTLYRVSLTNGHTLTLSCKPIRNHSPAVRNS